MHLAGSASTDRLLQAMTLHPGTVRRPQFPLPLDPNYNIVTYTSSGICMSLVRCGADGVRVSAPPNIYMYGP